KIADQIHLALLEAASGPYEFTGWQRQVRYKYSLSPLSPKGSLIEPGGRFNIPDMNPDQIPPFPSLYIAEDKETTLQEAGQQPTDTSELSPLDLALIKKDSISIVSVSGKLASIIDLHQPDKLKSFLNLIKGFSIPKTILQTAKKIGLDDPLTVQSVNALLESLLEPNWRAMCMQLDVPANCQIFGQLVANAGICGILYPSKFTKKKCLAIFPQNFDSEDYVVVDGDTPVGAVSRLDAKAWVSVKATL
ncbi:MAG: RES domain-containing protein, partial [Verrucomicrobia bacterium]|nr:RES domain-containing protein [Verrucomicrobiota bacterium]